MWDFIGRWFAELQTSAFMLINGYQEPTELLLLGFVTAVGVILALNGWMTKQIANANNSGRQAGMQEEAKIILEALKEKPQKSGGGWIWAVLASIVVLMTVFGAAMLLPEVF